MLMMTVFPARINSSSHKFHVDAAGPSDGQITAVFIDAPRCYR